MPARLVFVAFIGLSGFITYNALYLQAHYHPGWRPATQVGRARKRASVANVTTTGSLPTTKGEGHTHKTMQEASAALVTAVQRELAARGYHPGPDDGTVNKQTTEAIIAYQKAHHLKQTGEPSDALLRHIVLGESVTDLGGSSSVASVDMPASMVKTVQQVLAKLGYAPGPVDGVLGQNTKHAILAFQKDRHLPQTGDISARLLQELEHVTGRKFAGGAIYH